MLCITVAKYPSSVFTCFLFCFSCSHVFCSNMTVDGKHKKNILTSLFTSFNYHVVCGSRLWKDWLVSLVLPSPLMKRPAQAVFYVVWVRPCIYPRCLECLSWRSWLKTGVHGPTALPSCLLAFSSNRHLFYPTDHVQPQHTWPNVAFFCENLLGPMSELRCPEVYASCPGMLYCRH